MQRIAVADCVAENDGDLKKTCPLLYFCVAADVQKNLVRVMNWVTLSRGHLV
jgi:hypothetical protein